MTQDVILSMLFYLLIAETTIYMAYKVQCSRQSGNVILTRTYYWGIFMILFLCSAFRFNVGNDYSQYTQTAHEASVGGYVVTEPGFNWLVRLVYGVCGGEYYEVVFALFALFTLVLFLKVMYEQSEDFAFAFFLFMTLGLYFQTFNTVRYYLVLAMALYSIRFCLQRDWIKFICWILLASLFHKSVLIVIPIYWIAAFIWKKWFIITCVITSAVCFAAKKYVLKLALILYPSYENTVFLEGGTSVVTILRCLLVLGLYLWYIRYNKKNDIHNGKEQEIRMYAQLNFLALICCVFFSFLPVVTRIVYYFSVNQILMLPMVTAGIADETARKKVKYLIIAFCALYFLVFLMMAGQPGVRLLPYRSWLFESERFLYK